MTDDMNQSANSFYCQNRSSSVGGSSEAILLCQGRTDTLARIHKAVAKLRRQKKIEKLSSDANHWKGLS